MAEVSVGEGDVANALLELHGVGEAAVTLAFPICSPSTSMWNTPPVPGTRVTEPRSVPKVLSSSLAIHDARSSQLHWVQ